MSLEWDSVSGMKFLDENLSQGLKLSELVDVKNSNVRQEFILEDESNSFKLKFLQSFNLR